MVSSARDLGRYLTAVMGAGADEANVVSDSVRATLMHPGPRVGPGHGYAAGWHVNERDGERIIWHAVGSPQGRAALMIAPERDLGVAVLLNANHRLLGQPMAGIVNGVFDLLLDAEPAPAPGRGMAWVVVSLLALVPILVAASVFRTARRLRR